MAWNENLQGNVLEIASSDKRVLRVVAGPGTGKTFALMRRIAHLLEEGVDPTRIFLVTFTRVAARDLENELEKLNIVGANNIVKGTLHSYCFSILNRANVLQLTGRTPRPLMVFEERFLLEDLGQFNFGNIHQRKRRLKAFEAAWAREQDQQPGWPENETDRLFQSYLDEWLRFHKAILLGEFIPITLKYLRDNPGCPEWLEFDHVLVDEYQDLNRAEQSLLDLLSERNALTIIGDEDQSIYESFRYAHPEGIARFAETHEGTHDVPLELCRRCPIDVVIIANELIQNNVRRTGRVLQPMSGNPHGAIHVVQWPSMEAEAKGIAAYIDYKISTGKFEAGKVLILCPRRQFGYAIRDELRERNIAAYSFFNEEVLDGNPKQLDASPAQQSFTLLSLLRNPDDRVALRCWLGYGSQNLRVREYHRLREYCSKNLISPLEVLNLMANGNLSIPYTNGIVERYKMLGEQLDRLRQLHAPEVVDVLFPPDEEWAAGLRQIIERSVSEWTVENIYDALLSNITQPELPTDVEYVRIMSLHKSKGLTADHVIVTGMIAGILPSRHKEDLTFEEQRRLLEEQRRLFYVAITRPKQTLVLSSVLNLPRDLAYRMGAQVQGGNRDFAETIASTFLSELGPTCPRPVYRPEWVYY